ncbi:hypothetical protein [Streptomyces sp. NPDC059957]|uniref:hypothetical protein n=1 Tax=unclassified Streptomyces TaxID=2593676 RepID=UPI0036603C10
MIKTATRALDQLDSGSLRAGRTVDPLDRPAVLELQAAPTAWCRWSAAGRQP